MYRVQWAEVEADMPVSGSALLLGAFGRDGLPRSSPAALASGPSQLIVAVGLSDADACVPLPTLEAVLGVVRASGLRVWLVTAAAQSVGSGAARPSYAGVLGLARTVRNEAPSVSLHCIDVPASTAVPWRVMASSGADAEVALRGDRLRAPRLVPLPAKLAAAEDAAAAQAAGGGGQVLTGGTGGLGLLTARWLAESRGASALVLASRSGALARGGAAEWALLGASGADVRIARCDAADPAAVRRLLALPASAAGPRLCGVWHVAGVLSDALLAKQTAATLTRVYGPKAHSAWALQRGTAALPLEACALFSSVAALLGGTGQANYAAANSCLDALAGARRGAALAGVSVQWGPWAEVGMAAGGAVNARLQAQGWGLVGLAEGLAALGLAVGAGAPPLVAMMPVSWGRVLGGGVAPPFLSAFGALKPAASVARPAAAAPSASVSLETVMALVARTAGGAVDADAPLMEAGLDSLGAVELRNQLQQALGEGAPALPSTLIFDHPTARQLATLLQSQAAPPAAAAPSAMVSFETVMALVARTAGGAVDADAPLMEAGLDSLGAVELRNQLQQALGEGAPALPSTLIFDHPTARQLATLLQPQAAPLALAAPTATATESSRLVQSLVSQDSGAASARLASSSPAAAHEALGDCLLRLRLGDPSKPPLFALTSLDGSGTLFAPLQAEGDLYALQHEHVSTGARAALSEASLAELAAKYAALILAEMARRDPAAPDESAAPFVLLGVSFGSFLAHHVAVAADALGRPAAGLVLLEPWPVPPLLRDVIGTDRPQQV